MPKVLRWKSGASDRPATTSKFSSKWSHGNKASSIPSHSHSSHHEGDNFAISRAVSSVSEGESVNASRRDKRVSFDGKESDASEGENVNAFGGNKRVSFVDKESELIHREKLDEIKDLVLEKHNIDITSIILQIERADEAVPVEDDAQPESMADESESA